MNGPVCTGGGSDPTVLIVKLRSSVALAFTASPACDARMVQVPAAAKVTMSPLTVHVDAVNDEKVIGNPDDAVALNAKGGAPRTWVAGGQNVSVCCTCPTPTL
jgi:hypothetical protein